MIRDNVQNGIWNYEMLANWNLHDLVNYGMDQVELLKQFDIILPETEEDETKEKAPAVSKLGDIWLLGKHRLMCGDSTKVEDVSKLMDGHKADMVWTDPPYNVAYEGGGNYAAHGTPKREMIKNDEMSPEQFRKFISDAIKNMLDFCDGVFYICMSSKELAALKDAFELNGGHWQAFIIWVKNTFTLSRSDWQNQYEPILYGWSKKSTNHYFVGFRDEGNVWEGIDALKPHFDGEKTTINIGEYHLELNGKVEGRVMRKDGLTDIWREKKPSKSKIHPTMKPVNLVRKALIASSLQGQIVLDLFIGGGLHNHRMRGN